MNRTPVRRPEWGTSALRVLGFVALGLTLLLVLVPVAALTFSVRVQGHSMEPTLADGDRLMLDITKRHDIRRFDLVEATTGEGGANVVKRVIGLPGDRVMVGRFTKDPLVLVAPAGEHRAYRVINPTWAPQVGTANQPCCQDSGEAGTEPRWVTVPAGHYWVLGDNWGGSDDSRVFGWVASEWIGGRLDMRLSPLGKFGGIANPASLEAAPADVSPPSR